MSGDTLYVFGVLLAAVILFASNRVRPDIVALLVVLSLILSDVLTLREGLAGFGDPVILMMGSLFVIGEALVATGVAFAVGGWLLRTSHGDETLLLILMMVVAAVVAAFIGSMGSVALFLPIMLRIVNKTDFAARRLFMPLAFASLIGGMMTLIGAPANLMVNAELRYRQVETLRFFDFTPIGAAVLIAGIAYVLLIGRRFLKTSEGVKGNKQKAQTLRDLINRYGLTDQVFRIRIPGSSELVGQSLTFAKLRTRFGIAAIGIERQTGHKLVVRPALSETVLKAKDVFYGVGATEPQNHFIDSNGLERLRLEMALTRFHEELGLAEVLLPPESGLIKKTLTEAAFRERFQVAVLAIRRRGETVTAAVADTPLKSGDTLLVSGAWPDIARLRDHKNDVLVLTLPLEMQDFAPERKKSAMALGIVATMIVCMALALAPNAICTLVAALALIAVGCVAMDTAYKVIRWSALVLVGGMLPLAAALQKTGGTLVIVDILTANFGGLSPTALMVVFFLLTLALSTFVSATATALLIAPIAIGIASNIGVAPQAFAITVAIAASTGFLTPVSSTANTLVTPIGGYSFGDFFKVGLPLAVLAMVVTLILAPLLFPF